MYLKTYNAHFRIVLEIRRHQKIVNYDRFFHFNSHLGVWFPLISGVPHRLQIEGPAKPGSRDMLLGSASHESG